MRNLELLLIDHCNRWVSSVFAAAQRRQPPFPIVCCTTETKAKPLYGVLGQGDALRRTTFAGTKVESSAHLEVSWERVNMPFDDVIRADLSDDHWSPIIYRDHLVAEKLPVPFEFLDLPIEKPEQPGVSRSAY